MNLPCDHSGHIQGDQLNKGKHLGFLLEEIVFLTAEDKYHTEFESIKHSHGDPVRVHKYDFEVSSHGSPQCLAEIKSLRIIDGVFDPNRDKRLNNFKYTMYIRYMNGLEQGLNSDEMLTATRGNKNFIGYDVVKFLPKMDDVFQDIRKTLIDNTNNETDIKTLRLKKEKELGRKLTIQEILELKKGL